MGKRDSQSQQVTIACDAGGAGTVSITWENPFDSTDYAVIATAAQSMTTGVFYTTSKTASGITLGVAGSSVVSANLVVDVIANQNSF